MSDSRFVFGPLSPNVMAIPKAKKKRKKAKAQREALAESIAHTIMMMIGDGQSVVVLTKYDTDTSRIIRESE
jgi:hypothetical protein